MGLPSPSELDALLCARREAMGRLFTASAVGNRALGIPEWDWELWRIGRNWVQQHAPSATAPEQGPDVYLASRVYEIGGHTAVIGDFIRALDPSAGASHVVMTGALFPGAEQVTPLMMQRMGVAAHQVHLMRGETVAEKLDHLMRTLVELRPRRLFLFQHPEDPLAAVCAQPELSAQQFLVHHADANPTFGMHVPGVTVIDFHAPGAGMSRFCGHDPKLLPLTTPDPGPRPHGFLLAGALTTASSGAPHKFDTPYVYLYWETVAHVLSHTGGKHLHIGPLEPPQLAAAHAALRRAGVSPAQLVHVRQVPSVAQALWEHRVDVYLASFPISGARTRVDALASGTPYLRNSRTPVPAGATEDEWHWHHWGELIALLKRATEPGVLESQGQRSRRAYFESHSPASFARNLQAIVDGVAGAKVPDTRERTTASLLQALTRAELQPERAALLGQLSALTTELRAVQDEVARLKATLAAAQK